MERGYYRSPMANFDALRRSFVGTAVDSLDWVDLYTPDHRYSYNAAVDRTDGNVTISFVRKWARVYDLPRSVRRHVTFGAIAPTAAMHIARLSGQDRLLLAWAVLDHCLTVRQTRSIINDIYDGMSVKQALVNTGVELGCIELSLSPNTYRELRGRADLVSKEPETIVTAALSDCFTGE